MTLITFQNGTVVMRDGKVGTGDECCCEGCAPCPDLESLCIAITLTDYNGNVYTADQDNLFWFGGVGSVYLGGFDYAVLVSCDTSEQPAGIRVSAGWASFINDCLCTSGTGAAHIPCAEAADWYNATASGVIEFDDAGIPCDGGCPENLGSFSVTFSDPPC